MLTEAGEPELDDHQVAQKVFDRFGLLFAFRFHRGRRIFRAFRMPESSLFTYVFGRPRTWAISTGFSPTSDRNSIRCRRLSVSSDLPRRSNATITRSNLLVTSNVSLSIDPNNPIISA